MKKKKQKMEREPAEEVLQALLIVELAKAKVPQQEIRRIVGCQMQRVSDIARFFKGKGAKDPK